MALAVQNSRPDVVIGRLIHGLHEYLPELRASGLVPEVSLGGRIGLSGNNILKLSDAVSLVGPLPARD